MTAVRLIAQEAAGASLIDQLRRWDAIVAVTAGDAVGQRQPKGVDDKVNLRC
jgi:hypothetical protein